MTDPEQFKYDVRIRERMIRRGQVTEADVARHLEGLSDVETKCEPVPQHQPALAAGSSYEPDDDDEDEDEDEAGEAS